MPSPPPRETVADALTTGDRERALALLRSSLAHDPADVDAGLGLARLLNESTLFGEALDVLSGLWSRTRDPLVGDLLAETALAADRGREHAARTDREVVERLAGLFRALHGENGVLVDTLEYDIIGGLALDAFFLVPIVKAGFAARSGKSVVFFSGKSANPALVDMIGREIPVFRDERFPRLMPYCDYDWDKGRFSLKEAFGKDFFGRHADLFSDLVEFTHSTNGRAFCRTQAEQMLGHETTSPKITFSRREEERGAAFLRDVMGMGEGDWFVCVYARDGAYYGETPQSPNWFRNSDIRTFGPAIDEILARGGHVVRVGERTNRTLVHDDPRFLDYSNSPHRDPFLDVYLLGKCRFLLGTPSGLCHVTYVFRTPTLAVNSINLCSLASADLYIPKIVRDADSGERLPFREFLRRFHGAKDFGRFWENGIAQRDELRIVYEDNSPEDIRAAAVEMFDRLDGRPPETPVSAGARAGLRRMMLAWTPGMADTPLAAAFLETHAELFAFEPPA